MPKIRLIRVVFNAQIRAYEVPAFRGAVIDMIGREYVAFHNHIGDASFHYHYPFIQYKQQGSNASIVCIEDGVDDMQAFFQNRKPDIRIGNRTVSLEIKSLQLHQFRVQVWDKQFTYSLFNWLPLNHKNYQDFVVLDSDIDRRALLAKVLIGNILSMAKGIGWTVEKPIHVEIEEVSRERAISYKKVKLKAFDIRFKSNVFIPSMLGLGKGASTGFGTVRQIIKKETIKEI